MLIYVMYLSRSLVLPQKPPAPGVEHARINKHAGRRGQRDLGAAGQECHVPRKQKKREKRRDGGRDRMEEVMSRHDEQIAQEEMNNASGEERRSALSRSNTKTPD